MAEKQVVIQSGDVKLEGLLEDRPGDRAVAVTHPHPLYGGDMHNNVVQAVVEAYRQKGYSTLRFNFRGAGRSGGGYGQGKGEQQDVVAAVSFLSALGKARIDLAGYSFGAWVIARALDRLPQVAAAVLVSPPVDFLDFSTVQADPRFRLIIAGSEDAFASPATLQRLFPGWNREARFEIIEGADHFYWGREPEIVGRITSFLDFEP
jgi:hypothetical protein